MQVKILGIRDGCSLGLAASAAAWRPQLRGQSCQPGAGSSHKCTRPKRSWRGLGSQIPWFSGTSRGCEQSIQSCLLFKPPKQKPLGSFRCNSWESVTTTNCLEDLRGDRTAPVAWLGHDLSSEQSMAIGLPRTLLRSTPSDRRDQDVTKTNSSTPSRVATPTSDLVGIGSGPNTLRPDRA